MGYTTVDGGRKLETDDLQEALRALKGEDGKGDVVELAMIGPGIGDEGAKAIGEALKSNGTLTRLDLYGNQIGAEGAKAIGEALKSNDTLTNLYLARNKIGPEGAKAIGEGLKSNRTLTSLNLWDNEIGAEGAKAIGEALKVNGTLTSLNLFFNQIGDEGAKAIGEALKSNGKLTSLELGANKISVEGAKAIGGALKVNGTLTSLNLFINQIGDEGAVALFCTLEHRASSTPNDGSELDWTLGTKVPATSTSIHTPTPALEMIKRLIENGKGNFAVNISYRLGTAELKAFAIGWHQLKQVGISDLTMPPESVIHQGAASIRSFFNELSSGSKSQTKTPTQSKAEPQSKLQSTKEPSKNSPLPPTGKGKKSEQPNRKEAEKQAQEESNNSSRAKAVTEADREAHIKRLREIRERNLSKSLNAIKCMVLGEGRCGKSTSIGAFLGEPFDPNKRSTEGMEQEKCTIDVHAGRTGTGTGAGQHWKKSELDTSAMHERHLRSVAMDKNAVPADELRKRNFPPADPTKKKERRGSFLGFSNKSNSGTKSPSPSGTSQARLPGPPPSSMSSSSGSSDKSEREQEKEKGKGKQKENRQDDQTRSRRSSFGDKLKGYLPSSSSRKSTSASQQATPATPSEESATRRVKVSADEAEYFEKYLGKLSIPASSSNGISMEETDGEIEILLWDLGGQEVLHHLHQLYMTEYGFYMLVFNMERLAPSTCEVRKEALANIEFWLNTIAIQASRAKMFFLGTHLDTVPDDKDHRAIDQLLRSTFNIETNDQVVYNSESELSFWPIDNTGGSPHRTNAIRKKVEVVIQEQPFLKDFKIPVNWMRTLDELKQTWNSGELSETQTQSQKQGKSQKQSQNRPYVHMQELCELAAKCGVTNPDDIRDMLYWYNELGLTLHFPEGIALRDIVVLDPQWLVDAFSKLIRDPVLHIHPQDIVDDEFKRKHGHALAKLKTECIATDELIEALWTNLAPTVELRRFLKGVMINTGLGAVVNFYDDDADEEDDEDSPGQAPVPHDDLTANIDGPLFVPSIAPAREDLFAQLDREGSNRWRKIASSPNRLSMKVRFHNSLASAIFGRLVAVAIGTSVQHSQMNKAPCDFPQVSQSTATLSLGERKFAIELDDSNPYVLRITVAEAADARIIKDDLLSMIERINVEFMRGNLRYDVLLVIDSTDPEDSILYKRAEKAFKNVTSLESASAVKERTEGGGVGTNISCLSPWFLDVKSVSESNELAHLPEGRTFGEETVPRFGHDEMGPQVRAPTAPHDNHLFLSHAQLHGGDQVMALDFLMEQIGVNCWYDMKEGEKVTESGMREGIEKSEGFLLFLSKSVFERWAVRYEIKQALELNKPIVLVHESDVSRPGYCDIGQLANEPEVPDDFKEIAQNLIDEHCSVPYRRIRYEAKAMVGEIRRRFKMI